MAAISGLAAASGAGATAIVSYDFNDYFNGSSASTQAGTGLPVFAFGSLPGFSAAGQDVIHAVERSPGNFAVMLYNGDSPAFGNEVLADTGVAANDLGKQYRVSFQAAFGDYNNPNQLTQSGDMLEFTLLDKNNDQITDYLYSPTTTAFIHGSFDYTGTGVGSARLVVSGVGNSGQFGGAFDNVSISAVPEPAAWAMMLVGLGMVGGGLRRRGASGAKTAFA